MKIDRLISIIMILLNCDKMSAAKLADLFEVTPRTIYRDIEAIEKAGIPIFTTTGANGGIGILPEYKVDKSLFSASDIQNLLMGLESVSTALSPKELIGTLEKVKNLLPDRRSLNASQIIVDLTAWMGNKSLLNSIAVVRQALMEGRLLRFSYRDKSGTPSARQVEPYQLVLKDTHWYLQGYCLQKQDFRIFKLTRTTGLVLENQTFIPRDFFPKVMDGSGWMDQKLIPIHLLIDGSLHERMMELCGEERIKPYGDNRFLVDFLFAPDDYGYNLLLGFGDKCECISPPEIREELIRRIEKLTSLYR